MLVSWYRPQNLRARDPGPDTSMRESSTTAANTPKPPPSMQLDEYRKLAEVEDRMWYFGALNGRIIHWLKKFVPEGPARMLDAGCGTGGLIRTLNSVNPAWGVTGLDFADRACELARARTSAEIVQGSITALPFDDNGFDAVMSADVVCQVSDRALALRELARCTRPGGVIVVNVPAFMWLWSYHDETAQTVHRYTRRELVAECRSAGLEVLFATYVNLLPLPLIVARRKVFPPRNPTSDVRQYPAFVEATFRALACVEHSWTNRGWALPLGSSVFVVSRKT